MLFGFASFAETAISSISSASNVTVVAQKNRLTATIGPFTVAGTSFVGGIIDGTIKIPYGLVNLTAEVADALREDNIPVDQGYVAQLEKYFSNSVLGKIQQGSEDVVKETAIGKLTSAFTQLYAFGKAGADVTVKGATKAKQIYNKYAAAAKANKVVKARPDAVKSGLKARDLNKLTGKQNFAAVTLGGSGGAYISSGCSSPAQYAYHGRGAPGGSGGGGGGQPGPFTSNGGYYSFGVGGVAQGNNGGNGQILFIRRCDGGRWNRDHDHQPRAVRRQQ